MLLKTAQTQYCVFGEIEKNNTKLIQRKPAPLVCLTESCQAEWHQHGTRGRSHRWRSSQPCSHPRVASFQEQGTTGMVPGSGGSIAGIMGGPPVLGLGIIAGHTYLRRQHQFSSQRLLIPTPAEREDPGAKQPLL